MMQPRREAEEGWKADLLRVSSITCAPFMFYFLWLNMQYNSYIEDPALSQPLSFVDYLLSHTHDFTIIAFTVLIGSAGVLFGPIFARMRLTFKFGSQINKLMGKLSTVEENTTFQLMVIRRFKQINRVIAETMEHVVQSTGTMPPEAKQPLIQATAGLAEDLSKGLCSNLEKETLNLRKMLSQTQNHFTDYMENHNVKVQISCPDDLTVTADPLFTRLVFLNVLGFPICSTQRNGEVVVSVTQSNGYAHVEIKDRRYILSSEGQQYLKFPREFLAESHTLRQLCLQSGWGYEFKKLQANQFYTKVSIPLEDYEALTDNVMDFGFRQQ